MDRRQIEKQEKRAQAIKRAKQAEANRAGAGRKRQFERVEVINQTAPTHKRKKKQTKSAQVKKKKKPIKSAQVKKKPVKNTQVKKKKKPIKNTQMKNKPVRKKTVKRRPSPELEWQRSGMSREEFRQAERIKREKKKEKKKKMIKFFLVLAVLITGAILSVTVFFNIETIKVTGISQYSKEEIKDASGIRTGDNLILLRKSETVKHIGEKLPYTGEITINRRFPSTLEIQVEDTKIEAAVKSGGDYYILDGKGKVLKTVHSEKEVYKTVMEQKEIAKKQREALTKKKPEQKNPEQKNPEQKKPEQKEPEQKKPEQEKPEQKEPEQKEETPEVVPEDYKGDVIIIRGFKVKKAKPGFYLEIKDNEKYGEYERLLKLLKKLEIKDITGMDFSKKTDTILYYDDRIEIHLGTMNKLEQKLALGSKIIREQNKVSQEQKGLIDLAIPGKGYFSEGKPKIPQSEQEDEKVKKDSEGNRDLENGKKGKKPSDDNGPEDSNDNN